MVIQIGLLTGRVAIITGAASGIGKAQATLFVEEGASVVLADMNLEGVEAVAKELSPDGKQAIALKVNVLEQKDIDIMVEKTIEKFGKVDILCNTAGVFDSSPLMDTSTDLWDTVMNVNTKGLLLVTKTVMPKLKESKYASIINIASGAGLTGGGGGLSYTTAKHGVVGFTKQVAVDYKQEGIRSNVICPGLIETPMTAELMQNPEFVEKINKASGRLGQPEDVAKASLFLASDLAGYVNGVALPVDGGLVNSL